MLTDGGKSDASMRKTAAAAAATASPSAEGGEKPGIPRTL
jgi:hypothetical protein